MTLPDAAIVRQILGGNSEAFAVIVDRYYDRFARLATHLVGNRDDAEDVVQDTFLRAYRHLGSYQERDKFSAWITRILVNQCRTCTSKARRHAVLQPLDESIDVPTDGDAMAQSDHFALQDELASAMARLVPEQREAVVLRFSDDLTYDEMAAVTGASVSALKMRVQRACARLRALLTEKSHV
jgi:RNA polymerase sigma-70 factor (ECF subfamily)